MPNLVARTTYDTLLADISGLYEGARKALVASYWQIGQRIVEVEQDGEVKAEYGTGLLQSLSNDLSKKFGNGCSVENLRRMRRFYLRYPKQSPATDLTWSQHVELLPVGDKKKRRALEKRAIGEDLSKEDLRKVVADEVAVPAKVVKLSPLKPPTDLRLLTFGEVTDKQAVFYDVADGDVLLDCGFFLFLSVSAKEAARVTLTNRPSFAYAAKVERVIDGDTLLVILDLGFGASVREKLRLRGINTPELGTFDGEKAKKFVAGLLPAGTSILVKSHKTDVYGRFVADIFIGEEYLNQRLLDDRFAVRMAD